MKARTGIALLVVLALPLVVAPEASSIPGAPVPQCSPGPASCTGWYTGNVTVSWVYDPTGVTQTSGCNVKTVTSDGVSAQSCEVWYGDSSFARTITLRRDATPPQVTGSAFERGPDANGWYNRPVAVTFSGTDATSGIAACAQLTYGGPEGASQQVAGTCRDVAGNTSAPATAALKYDATAPAVSAAADRPPDGNGWYRRPLTVTFAGSDAVSGVAACAGPARYSGPEREGIAIAGACRDVAGNVSAEQRFVLNYDATAPKLGRVRVQVARGVARVEWRKPADAVRVEIERMPGVNGAKKTHVYTGTGERFLDRTVREGVRYRYQVNALDAAGNTFGTVVATGPQPVLFAPPAGEAVRAPVTLAWKAAPGARYYNVQLRRNGAKVLSVWPRTARFRVPRSWRFLGKTQSLRPGRYTWHVWPGLGAREQARYGTLLGSSSFVVKR